MLRCSLTTVMVLLAGSAAAQTNPQYTYSIDGPCGGTIVGPPGSVYDDGTGGAPYFTGRDFYGGSDGVPRMRPGHTWDIFLTTENNIVDDWGVYAWQLGLGVEGPLRITDITVDGTAGCSGPAFPQCLGRGQGFLIEELTGPPDGSGPQTEDNVGAVSYVLFKLDGVITLPPEGSTEVCKIRVSGDFPELEGESAQGRVFFAPRTHGRVVDGVPRYGQLEPGVGGPVRSSAGTIGQGDTNSVTVFIGDPPLQVQDCVVTLKASSVAAFVRCDANADGKLNVSDAVWMLTELFLGGTKTACEPAADCDGNGERELSDAVYALTHLFQSGPEPPAPYPRCDRIDVPVEECPPGSTGCE